jgi:chromate transporter
MFCIFVVAPWVEALRRHRAASRALAGVTAAVLGVIVHLAVVFGGAVLWPRAGLGGIDLVALALTIAAFGALASRKVGLFAVIAAGAALGALRALLAP